MAVVMPFKGVRYNSAKIEDLGRVVAPPYDVITPKDQEYYYLLHQYNVIRLILGKQYPTDGPGNDWFSRAASFYREWRQNQILVRDNQPGLYLYEIEYPFEEGFWRKRTGVVALVKLEDFKSGVIRPHEKTFTATKNERLRLRKACGANLSPVFGLYSDPEGIMAKLTSPFKNDEPACEFSTEDAIFHRMWRITDPAGVRDVHRFLLDKEIFIADGHHRYETALSYFRFLSQNTAKDLTETGPAFVMMYLCPMEEKGLTILPAHRLLSAWPHDFELEKFLEKVGQFFEVQFFPFNGSNQRQMRTRFRAILADKGTEINSIGFFLGGESRYFLFSLKKEALKSRLLEGIPAELKELDVVLLTRLLLQGVLNMEEKDLDDEFKVQYLSRFNQALDLVEQGRYAASFLLNPTPVHQIRKVARASLVMPRKSTYFYPKVISGLVFNDLDPEEKIVLP
jgi:uncharacterized protein (DUF1015 family)